ncbi:MAG: altronate dehydratase family protein [Caldimonas sp.]
MSAVVAPPAPSGAAAGDALVIRIHPHDDVVIARRQLVGGTRIESEGITVAGLIPPGHKVAARPIAAGAPVRRYDQIIGTARQAIAPGQHVHTHNLEFSSFAREYAAASGARPTEYVAAPATFDGIVRADGRIATRNYVGILTSVNCSATVARAIADHFRRDTNPRALERFPNVDGVVALTHGAGCATDSAGEPLQVLRRTLGGYARHANFASVVVVGLGCETNQISGLMEQEKLGAAARAPGRPKPGSAPSGGRSEATWGPDSGPALHAFNIQETGGTKKTVAHGIELVEWLLEEANRATRTPVPASHILVGLQCGGSDGYSGISANPALGAAVDRLVRHGGTAILSETPEIYGGEHLLTRRAVSTEVADKLVARIRWWERYCERNDAAMDNNPSAGNKAGGLTTILEKSLGAIAKSGTTNLVDVVEYAQPVTAKGLVFMDTPGYDPVSATGQVAGGANLICFTTGRGSAYGCAPSPSLKLSTNTALWTSQEDDIDINCGDVIDGTVGIDEMGERIFRLMLATASGQKTKSEVHGYGQNEFVPWSLGAVM